MSNRAGKRAFAEHETSDRVTGIGGQANSGEPREVRLEVLADHITDVHGVMSEREGGER